MNGIGAWQYLIGIYTEPVSRSGRRSLRNIGIRTICEVERLVAIGGIGNPVAPLIKVRFVRKRVSPEIDILSGVRALGYGQQQRKQGNKKTEDESRPIRTRRPRPCPDPGFGAEKKNWDRPRQNKASIRQYGKEGTAPHKNTFRQ